MRTAAAGLVLAGVMTLAAGCGSDDGSTARDTPSPSAPASSAAAASPAAEGPDCAEVWVKGARLKQGYRGCVRDGTLVAAHTVECSSGQALVLYADRFWAVRGGLIKYAPHGLTESNAYLDDLGPCVG